MQYIYDNYIGYTNRLCGDPVITLACVQPLPQKKSEKGDFFLR